MPITSLQAVSNVSGFNGWTAFNPGGAGNKPSNVNSDDSGAGSRINIGGGSVGVDQLFEWDPLPTAARGGVILQFEIENCARRGGGCTTGRYHNLLRDPVTTTLLSGTDLIPGAGLPCQRIMEVFPTNPDGLIWTQPLVDRGQYGVEGGPVTTCTGINVYFQTINVTWTGSTGPFEVDGIFWLGPLIMAGLRGLNLMRESVEQLTLFDLCVYRQAYRKVGIKTHPSLIEPSEREKILWEMFKQPAYAF